MQETLSNRKLANTDRRNLMENSQLVMQGQDHRVDRIYSRHSEANLIAALLKEGPKAFGEMRTHLTAESFYDKFHALAYLAAESLLSDHVNSCYTLGSIEALSVHNHCDLATLSNRMCAFAREARSTGINAHLIDDTIPREIEEFEDRLHAIEEKALPMEGLKAWTEVVRDNAHMRKMAASTAERDSGDADQPDFHLGRSPERFVPQTAANHLSWVDIIQGIRKLLRFSHSDRVS